MSTTKHYQIQITGGTSTGPYTVYYGVVPNPPLFTNSIVPPIYPISDPIVYAQNLTLPELTGEGIIVEVPSATTVLYLYNQLCPDNTITLVPTNNIVYQDLCMTFEKRSGVDVIQFIYGGINSINNTPYWVDEINDSITIKWNGTNWDLTGYQPFQNNPEITILSSDSISANPPILGWQPFGVDPILLIITPLVGNCPAIPALRQSYPVSINQPTCLCDGSILFNPNLDNPPFTYSINNGVTYSDSPIFSNLCSGIYSLSILDSLGNNFGNTITLNEPTFATTYTLSLNTIPSTQINNPTTISKTYETTIIVTPELPDGTTVYFDLIHNKLKFLNKSNKNQSK
jgi:hypothetical protein